jgi:hypothetical protein
MTGEQTKSYIPDLNLSRISQIAARASLAATAFVSASTFNAEPSLAEGPIAAHTAEAPVVCDPGWIKVENACFSPDSGYTPTPGSNEQDDPSQDSAKEVQGPLRHVSFNQCDISCGSACGIGTAADVVTDLTGYYTTPKEILPKIKEFYHPGAGGTTEEAFFKLAKIYHLKATKYNVDSPYDLKHAVEVIAKMGGVAVTEFGEKQAVHRSGKHSKVAVVAHWTALHDFKYGASNDYADGKFRLADPHKGTKRFNEKTPKGNLRWWGANELYKNGLYKIITLSPTDKTPVNPKYN